MNIGKPFWKCSEIMFGILIWGHLIIGTLTLDFIWKHPVVHSGGPLARNDTPHAQQRTKLCMVRITSPRRGKPFQVISKLK